MPSDLGFSSDDYVYTAPAILHSKGTAILALWDAGVPAAEDEFSVYSTEAGKSLPKRTLKTASRNAGISSSAPS